MPESTLVAAVTEFAKAALSDAAKEYLRDWLTDVVRIKRAINRISLAFSTQVPGAKDALEVWVKTDAFRLAMGEVISGRALPESLTRVDEFLVATGVGFGSLSRDVVSDMLAAFYRAIREELVTARSGLVLTDNRVGEVLREVHELRSDLAANLPSRERLGLPRVSRELLNGLAKEQGWGANIGFASEIHINLELPPSVQTISKRPATVHSILHILRTATWYAIHGGSGSGKTQLAILVGQAFVGPKIWIRLGGQQPAAGLVLEMALAKLSARHPEQSTQDWCECACKAIGPGGIIVLDDLPRTSGHEAVDEHLMALCMACAQTGVRLVTASADQVASATRAAVASRLHEEPVPDFDEGDIRDLFLAYGAPEPFLSSTWFGFAYRSARRHPVLLVEAARYLQARGWATDDRSFDDLLGGAFAGSLDLSTVERIRETVPNERTREFLYRLKLIGWPFGIKEVQQASSVPLAIPLPLEHLSALVGLWVQQDTDREYVLSPLVSRLSDDNLPRELQRAIHLALAQGIIEKHRFGPFEASKAITHFIAAEDINGAVVVLLVALHGMLGISGVRDPFVLTGVWAGMPLPAEIALEKRIYIRSLQVILRDRLGLQRRYELQDLELLLAEGEHDEKCQLVIAGVGAMLATYLGDREPGLAIRAVAKGIKAARRVDPSTETKIEGELDLQTGLLTLLWVIAAWIRTDEEYQQWFAALADLTPDELANWRTIHLGDQASEAICGGVWTRTADLPDLERNWVGVLGELKRLEAWARSAGASWLATCTVRSQIIVTAEYQKDIRKADVIARQGMEEFQDLPKAKFWIADTMARQHHYFGEAADAVHWFDLALASQDAADVGARVSALTLAGVAASRLGIDGIDPARRYFEQGGAAADSKRVGALPRVTVKGELGILLWNTGHRREAYTAWSGAVQELLAARSQTKQWKNLLRLVGNCTGYFILNSRGVTIEDAEMTTPFPGILLREITDILGLYKPEDDWLLPVQMVLFAESVGAFDDAIDWAARTKVCDGAFGAGSQALITGAQVVRDLADHQYEKIVLESDIGDLDEAGDPVGFATANDDIRALRVTRYVARLNLVALCIELARIRLHERSRAQAIAHSLTKLSRECAARHGESRFWLGTAAVFDAFQGGELSWRELWHSAANAGEQGNSALQVMYGIAATVVAGPTETLQIQLQIVPWVERLFTPTLFHFTMGRFVSELWLAALDQYPMGFSLLNRTRLAITNATALDDKPKVHAILNSVAFSLGTRLSDGVQRWLDNSSVSK